MTLCKTLFHTIQIWHIELNVRCQIVFNEYIIYGSVYFTFLLARGLSHGTAIILFIALRGNNTYFDLSAVSFDLFNNVT